MSAWLATLGASFRAESQAVLRRLGWRRPLPSWATIAAALVCLLLAASLRDLPAPPASAAAGGRVSLALPASRGDANLRLTVTDERGGVVAGALVELFTLADDAASLARREPTGPDGVARLVALPRAEAWLSVRARGFARTTTRVVLVGGEQQLRLTLPNAQLFEVVTVDGVQRPIRGVTVRLYGNDPLPFEAVTDAQGLASFAELGPAPYVVEAVARGFDAKLVDDLRADDSPLFLKLEPLGTLVISVVAPSDAEGAPARPAAGATVTVAGSGLWPARTAVTDADGRVTIAGLARGFYDLRAQQDALVSDPELGVLLERGETKALEIRLLPGVFVQVLVTDGDEPDAPRIAGADVALVEGGISSFPQYGRTDGAGLVVLGPVVGIDATVAARADGFVPRGAVPVDEGQTEVQVGLSRGGRVVGRVVDEQDYPVEGASVEVLGIDVDGMPIAESSSITSFRDDHFTFALAGAVPLVPVGELGVMPLVPDIPSEPGALVVGRSSRTEEPWASLADGSFALHPVPPGRIHLVARHPDYVETVTETFRLDVGQEHELRIVLRQGGLLEGRVVEEDGSPVAAARVELAALEGAFERITYAADDGTFAFAAVPARALVSVARPEAMETVVARLVLAVAPGERTEAEIVLPERRETVTLSVVDDRGYPLDRVELRASSVEPGVPLRATLFTDDAGEATLADARGLDLRLVLARSGQAPLVVQVPGAPAQVALQMSRALSAHGEVWDPSGPLPDATVTLFTPTGVRHARTDEQGEFAIENLAATGARLLVHRSGLVPREEHVELAGEPGDRVDLGRIELDPAGAVSGQVLDPNDEPIPGAWIAVGRVPTYLPLGPMPLGMASTDRSGRFELRDVTPGRQTIEAYVPGIGRSALRDVVVRAEETTEELRIVIEPEEEPPRPVGAGSLAVTLTEQPSGGQLVVRVVHVPAGGEAEHAGIEPADRLLAVDGARVRGIEQARRLLTGPLSEDMVLMLAREPDMRWLVRVPRERLRR